MRSSSTVFSMAKSDTGSEPNADRFKKKCSNSSDRGHRQLFQTAHARTEFFNHCHMSKARRCKAAKTEEPRLRHQAAEWSDFSRDTGSKEIVQAYLAPVAACGSSLPHLSLSNPNRHDKTDSDTSQWLGPYA